MKNPFRSQPAPPPVPAPTEVPHPGYADTEPCTIPLGPTICFRPSTMNGSPRRHQIDPWAVRTARTTDWDTTLLSDHACIVGPAKSGKTNLVRVITEHALHHQWEVVTLNSDLDEAVKALTRLVTERNCRRAHLEAIGGYDSRILRRPPAPILVVIDDADTLLNARDDDPQADLRAVARAYTHGLLRHGARANIQVCVAGRRPLVDPGLPATRTDQRFDARIVTGPLDDDTSKAVLRTTEATQLETIPGRALYQHGNYWHETEVFQAFHLTPEPAHT